jgi:Transcriptional activator TraM
MDKIISYIAETHGVAVSKDDPILIAYSINKKMMDENAESQGRLLEEFKDQIEKITEAHSADILEKAARILNAAVVANKTAVDNQIKQSMGYQVKAFSDALTVSELKAEGLYSALKVIVGINVVLMLAMSACVLFVIYN